MEFKKKLLLKNYESFHYLAEPVVINYDELFVKVKYWYPNPNHDCKVIKEKIINYNVIEEGE